VPSALLSDSAQRRLGEVLLPASVILAGVLLVVAFGFIINRAMRDDADQAIPLPQPPAFGTDPLVPSDQALIPLPSPSTSASRSTAPTTPPTSKPTSRPAPPDRGSVELARAGVPGLVDLSGEGDRDWVHWGQDGTFSLERDADGGFDILEGAPTAPRFRHALSPEKFAWSGGSPVARSDGTPTGIRTCGQDNGFTLTAPAGRTSRTLRVYVGAFAARGRLEARLSTGGPAAVGRLEERDNTLATAVFRVTYRAPKDGTLKLNWITEESFDSDCGGVALQAATLR
jgi:hypothetical protein